jgi:ubiquinone/menaquinone biosynthesis C-methylase UbiE
MTTTELEKAADSRAKQYIQERSSYWDRVALRQDRKRGWGGYYHRRLTEIYRSLISPGQRVIELGCGVGDLLAALTPSYGIGVDFSAAMIDLARERHPELNFIQADIHELNLTESFDVVILSDLLNDVWDVQTVLEKAAALATPQSRIILNSYSRLWEIPLWIAQHLGLANPVLQLNWLTVEDIINLESLADLEVIRSWHEILFPLPVPGVTALANKILVKIWPFNQLGLTNFILARPRPAPRQNRGEASVSIIIPARNEAGNIPEIFKRTPQMGQWTELVFVEGHSRDNTFETIRLEIEKHPENRCKLLRQAGVGKGDAVRCGFANASGDILMVLDADLTVPAESLTRFYHALVEGKGELINGVRLVYPLERQAMRFLNFLGNKFFSLAFSWVLGQSIKDTLCGTKVLWKSGYEKIALNRAYFGDFDPFGDFDLIFGAVKLNYKIVDLPIRYRERIYGETNIQRWKDGWLLIKMLYIALKRIKFV